jgi:colicin import membrane protein
MKPTDEREPGRGAAFLLAVLMHVLFFILLVFGISWQSRHPQATAVDLWADVPPSPQPVAPPKPAPEVKAPPAPMPEARPEPKPEPKPKPEAKPEPVKPDILLKEKAEKERIEKEKAEKEKLKLEQQRKLAEAKRKVEAEQQRQTKEQLAKEDDARQLQKDKEDAIKALEADQAAAQDRLVKDYIDKIQAQIRRYVVVPPDIQGNPQAVYKVVLLPGGVVLSATLEKSSGVAAYDSSIERAINKAQPLPLPPDPAQFPKFRELELQFRPND